MSSNQMVVTRYDPPPTSFRCFDWRAVPHDYDIGSPIGFGATREQAIDDLLEQIGPNGPPRMDAKIKADWLRALRSGEYRQGTGRLHNRTEESYCCLGVLCRVLGAEFREASNEYEAAHLDGRTISSDEELKQSFCQEIGLPDQKQLIILNDGFGDSEGYPPAHSFTEIADYIEEHL